MIVLSKKILVAAISHLTQKTMQATQLVLTHQWFIEERIAMDFADIPDATAVVYWPKHEGI